MLLLCLAVPRTVPAASTPCSVNGRLSIKNGKVVNSSGKTFVIKGVSTHGIAWYPDYISKAAFKTLRDQWGVNTIRLAMYSAEYNGYCTGGNKTQLLALIDKGVKYANDLGMYVIIDWHILSDGNPLTYKSQANSFFKTVAKKYSGYKNVLYEICNEPNGSGGSWSNIRAYAKTIIKTIRSVDKKAIIIVGTPTWSQDVEKACASPITGYSNIAYAFHFYAGTHQESMRNRLEAVLKKKLPVIVTEFGISEASGGGKANTAQGNKWMTLLNKYGVGRVCWNLSNKNETCALLKSGCTKKSGWSSSDLSASGSWLVKQYTGKSVVTPTPTPSPSSSSESAKSSGTVKLTSTARKVNSWKSGGSCYTQYSVTVKNTGSKTSSGWTLKVTMSAAFSLDNSWCADYKKSGQTLTITPLSWNKAITAGSSTEIGFIVKASGDESIRAISISS